MIKIFLSTHGKMASGMKNSLDILLGNTDCLTVFDAYINEEPVEKHLEDFFTANPENSCIRLLVSDIYGGSVNQVLSRYCNEKNTYVITGINLALLMSLVLASDRDIEKQELINMIEESKTMTQLVSLDFDVPEQEEFF